MDQATLEKTAGQQVAELKNAYDKIMAEMSKVIVGQKDVIEQIIIGLLCKGHCLVEGMPGLAKTSIIRNLARLLDLKFQRIQFTPDLMPADIVGTEIIDQDTSGQRVFRFVMGPIFANVILADEINRTPPKTQAALLESMQEHHVTAAGNTYPLDPPFLVLGTQNPIDQEGTYPLPEAQLDRFMLKILIDYPTKEEEIQIAESFMLNEGINDQPVLTKTQIMELQEIVKHVIVARHVSTYAVSIARSTRPSDPEAPDFIKKWVNWGASPRASQFMLIAGKARAILDGRLNVSCEDIRAVAPPILRHRLGLNFTAESEDIGVETIISKVLEYVQEPIPKRSEN